MSHVIRSVLASARRTLDAAEMSSTDADIVMAHLLRKDRCYLVAHGDAALTVEQVKCFQAQITQRCTGVPVAYLTGQRDFLEFYTSGESAYIDTTPWKQNIWSNTL